MSAKVKVYIDQQSVTLDMTFSLDGTLTDPTTLAIKFTEKGGATKTYTYTAVPVMEIVKISTGTYRFRDHDVGVGTWVYEVKADGAVQDRFRGEVYIVAEK